MTMQRFLLGVTAVLALSFAGMAAASDFPIDVQGTSTSDVGAAETQVAGNNDTDTWSATSSHSDSVSRAAAAPATTTVPAPAARTPTTPSATTDDQSEAGALVVPPKARSNRWQSLVPGAIK